MRDDLRYVAPAVKKVVAFLILVAEKLPDSLGSVIGVRIAWNSTSSTPPALAEGLVPDKLAVWLVSAVRSPRYGADRLRGCNARGGKLSERLSNPQLPR